MRPAKRCVTCGGELPAFSVDLVCDGCWHAANPTSDDELDDGFDDAPDEDLAARSGGMIP